MSCSPVAFHEAGHAVLSIVLELDFELVTIVENEYHLGSVRNYTLVPEDFDERPASEFDDWARRTIISLAAGLLAATRGTGIENEAGTADDFDAYTDLVLRISGDEESAQRNADELWREADKLVEDHWDSISSVARALDAKKTLSMSEIERLVRPKAPNENPERKDWSHSP